ncbi:DUF1697 domain-containing protein [uncultured Sphingomonas sp.]|uniref:DUF1697 domain-containing protein n=1 Tax=uncultured Sphingomonas sp. TaxID=158754 RepID=UPI0025DC44E5|nr:DUF1697 domain-containing protein [uncultured Sphingomonas sp.]
MTAYVALLRAVNVGGTGKLPMAELRAMAEAAGFARVETYIASGNVVFTSDLAPAAVQASLAERLTAYAGKPVDVLVRTAADMAEVRDANPFAGQPADRTIALFVDRPLAAADLAAARNVVDEQLRLGPGVIYVFYGAGMARSRLVIPAAAHGTARNINSVAKLAEMAGRL